MYLRYLTFLFFIICCCPLLKAQYTSPYVNRSLGNFVITNWQTEQGLPQNSVQPIIQTKDGYLWFGTQQGLVRFDGYSFKVFGQNRTSIFPFNNILAIAEDPKGGLWIGTIGGGVFYFDKKDFIPLLVDGQRINAFTSRIFCGTTGDLFIEDKSGLHFIRESRHIKVSGMQQDQFIRLRYQYEESAGNYILSNPSGKIFRLQNDTITQLEFPSFPGGFIHTLVRLSANSYVSSTPSGLFTLHEGKISPVLYKGKSIPKTQNIVLDKKGGFWVISENAGVYYCNGNDIMFFNAQNGLSHSLVFSLYCDNENNIWTGTLAAGVNKISRNFLNTLSAVDGMPNEFLFSINRNKNGNLTFGSYSGGLFTYSKADGTPRFYREKYFAEGVIRTVFYDVDGVLWAGSFEKGLLRIDDKETKIYTTADGLPSNSIYSIFQDREKNIWIGTENGVVKFSGKTKTVYTQNQGLSTGFVRTISQDNEGNIWLGSHNGGIFLISGDKLTNFTSGNEQLSQAFIRSIRKDSDGKMWIATSTGLYRYFNNSFVGILNGDALPDNPFYDLLEDDYGKFWLSSNHGIYVIGKDDLNHYIEGKSSFINYALIDKTDGMLSSECNGGNQPGACKGTDGLLYFPTLKGALIINPVEYRNIERPIPLHIEKVLADDKEVLFGKTIIIPAGVNRMEIFYSGLSFTNSEKISFRYQLKGLESKPVFANRMRSVAYTGITPGEYEFILTAGSGYGAWTSAPLTIKVIIEPYFYQTTWFMILWICLLVSIIPALYYLKIRSYKQRQEELTRTVEERTQSLRLEKEKTEAALQQSDAAKIALAEVNIQLERSNKLKTDLMDIAAHDLKNPLNAIKGFSQVLLEENTWHSETNHMVTIIHNASSTMLTLVDDMLKSSRLEQQDIHLKLEKFSVCEVLESVAERNKYAVSSKNQQLKIECDEHLQIVTDKFRLLEVLDNLVSNAVKYSHREKNIVVRVHGTDEKTVLFTVKDQGQGMTSDDIKMAFGKFVKLSARPTENESSTGLGLSIVKSLLELMGGKIWIESKPGEGTTFYFTLPNGEHNLA